MTKTFSLLLASVLTASIAACDEDSEEGDASSTNAASDDTTAADASTASSADDDPDSTTTSAAGGCGWDDLPDQTNVQMGYTCGGQGEDPRGIFPIECPTGVALEAGGSCGGNMGVTGVGCCDGNVVWYCAEGDAGPQLFTEDCGPP